MKIQKTNDKILISLPFEWKNKKADNIIKLLAIEFKANSYYSLSKNNINEVTFEINNEIINNDLFINVLIGTLLNCNLVLSENENDTIILQDIS